MQRKSPRLRAALLPALAFAALGIAAASPVQASSQTAEQANEQPAQRVCEIIAREARRRALPETFFARLIWKESAFNPRAVSPKGAQGIAQFMPATAKERGLADPFKPAEALTASAHLLSELIQSLGNLGLAAAAYNAGLDRVRGWLDGRGNLPLETRDYVFSITGRPANDWAQSQAQFTIPPIGKGQHFLSDCAKLASRGSAQKFSSPVAQVPQGRWKPWGVQVAGSHSEKVALASFEKIRARHSDVLGSFDPMMIRKRNPGMGAQRMVNVRIGAATRAEADRLCAKLLQKGCACVVLKN
jgi:hypothetical protein